MKTFDEWSKAGYKINKGAKGTKVGNSYYFTDSQVAYSPRRSYSGTYKGCDPTSRGTLEYDEEEDEGEGADEGIRRRRS